MQARKHKCLAGIALVSVTVLLATTSALANAPEQPKVKFNAADQASARAIVLRRGDLLTASGAWKGGLTKPALSPPPVCANYHPRQSDLVITGAAESDFTQAEAEVDSEAVVLQTAHMVQLDWQRLVLAPGAVPCLRQEFEKSAPSGGKIVSFGRAPFPKIARYSAAFVAVLK